MSPRITTAELEEHERQKSRPASPQKRRAAPTPKERDIQRAILAFLATVPGVVAWRQNSGAALLPGRNGKPQPVRFGVKGCADIIGWWQRLITVKDGVEWRSGSIGGGPARVALFLAIEVKRLGQYPSFEQQAFLNAVKAAGGIAIVARSVHDVALALGLAAPASGAGARPR